MLSLHVSLVEIDSEKRSLPQGTARNGASNYRRSSTLPLVDNICRLADKLTTFSALIDIPSRLPGALVMQEIELYLQIYRLSISFLLMSLIRFIRIRPLVMLVINKRQLDH